MQKLTEPVYTVWLGNGPDAVFVGVMTMTTLGFMLNLHPDAEDRIVQETAVKESAHEGWCRLFHRGANYYVATSGRIQDVCGIGPGEPA